MYIAVKLGLCTSVMNDKSQGADLNSRSENAANSNKIIIVRIQERKRLTIAAEKC